MNPIKLQNFEEAMSDNTCGCRLTCHCGKEFYDVGNDYDWEEGELESLEEGPAIGVYHSIDHLTFEGRHYVDACNCWHERAKNIMSFIDSHAHEIAAYLKLEKQRRLADAQNFPSVD